MTDQLLKPATETPAAIGENELLNLMRLINDELTTVLRVQSDDTVPVQQNNKLEDIGRHICIEAGGKQLAIPLSSVLEAGDLQTLQSLPLLPDWLSGITNIRGEIVSVVNLALFLGCSNKASAGTRPFLVVHDDTLKIAVTVDRVIGTRTLFVPPTKQEKLESGTLFPVELSAGKAIYKKQDGKQEIDLFDLNGFLSSRKLRDVTPA